MSAIDPVTFSVIWGGLLSAASEMGFTLERTAYSVVVREGSDFSTGIFDAEGRMVAQGDYSPGHLGSMAFTVRRMLEYYPVESLSPGDAVICNDPGIGSGHLPDIFMVSPVFHEGQRIGFAVNIAHHMDIGGGSAGGQEVVGIAETYQEGIKFMPTMLFKGGEPVRDIFRIVEANVRVPDVLGDLRAQYAANMTAAARLQALAAQYGPDVLQAGMAEVLARTEAAMKAAIAALPKGTFRFFDRMDDTGPGTEPVLLNLALTITDDKIICDWTGTGAQRDAGLNAYLQYTTAYCIAAIKAATLPLLPQNQGMIGCVEVVAPLGSYVNPELHMASGGRSVNSHRLYEVVMGALAQAVPDKVIAANAHFFNPNIGGRRHVRTGKRFVAWDIVVGGVGARPDRDGQEATSSPWNGTNIPIEAQEINNPVLVERVELIPDTAGAGRFRGGMAMRKDVRLLADSGTLYNLGDRHVFPPYSLDGAMPPALGRTVLNPGAAGEQDLASKGTYALVAGDVVSWRTSGAGGRGDPLTRDPEAVLRDVRAGLVSREAARRDYGVAVAGMPLAVDMAATDALRRAVVQSPALADNR